MRRLERQEGDPPGCERVRVRSEVQNFYPLLRGSGWFARIGSFLYSFTQLKIHVIVSHGFLRSLARLDLPESTVGALAEAEEEATKEEAPARPRASMPSSMRRRASPRAAASSRLRRAPSQTGR